MMIDPINSSAHALAELYVGKRNHKEQNSHSKKDRVLHLRLPPPLVTSAPGSFGLATSLELDHDVDVDKLLISPQIRKPNATALRRADGLRGAQSKCSRTISVVASKELGRAVVRVCTPPKPGGVTPPLPDQ